MQSAGYVAAESDTDSKYTVGSKVLGTIINEYWGAFSLEGNEL